MNKKETLSPLEYVRKVLKEINTMGVVSPFKFRQLDNITAYLILFNEEDIAEGAIAHLNEEKGMFSFYIDIRIKADTKQKLNDTAEFITRANSGLDIGNFELDYSDGSIRFKSSISYKGIELSEYLIANIIIIALIHTKYYKQGLNDVLNGKISPEEAIALLD